MRQLILALLGIGLVCLGGDKHLTKQYIELHALHNADNGVYETIGYLQGNSYGVTISNVEHTAALKAYGCNNCEGYGIARIVKSGQDFTVTSWKYIGIPKPVGEQAPPLQLTPTGWVMQTKEGWVPLKIKSSNGRYQIDDNLY